MLFEHFNVQGLYIVRQATSVLYSSGRVTGTVVDSGYDLTEVTPVHESIETAHASQSLQLGGSHLTDFLSRLIHHKLPASAGNSSLILDIWYKIDNCLYAS